MSSCLKENFLTSLEQIEGMSELKNISGFQEELQQFRARLLDDEFRIAVVGEFSSGKSTFINALLGKDILQHATTETTATLTRVINVKQEDSRCKTGRVFLRTGDIFPLSNFDELKEYTTTASKKYNVVNDVMKVELYLHILSSDRNIVFVDTPGLNGMADGHREQTIRLIQQAHSCIYLLPRRGLADSDIHFLTYLAQYQKNFLFVQNFIDDFRKSEGETLEEKLRMQREILGNSVFADWPDCQYEICGISALKALVAQDKSIQCLYDTSTRPLTPEERPLLYEQSNFEQFRILLSSTFQDSRLETLQYRDTALAIYTWTKSLLERIQRRKDQTSEVYEASRDKRMVEKLQALKGKILENKPRHIKNLENFVSSQCSAIQHKVQEELRAQLSALDSSLSNEIHAFKTVSNLEAYAKGLGNQLDCSVGRIVQTGGENCQLQFQKLYQVMLQRIEEYSGIHAEELNPEAWAGTSLAPTQKSFQSEDDSIRKLEKQITEKRRNLQQHEKNIIEADKAAQVAQGELNRLEQQRSAVEQRKAGEIARLGTRPAAVKREEPYTDYVYRGGLGFLDAIFGPKEVTRWRTVTDDSAGKAWDAKNADIQNEFAVQQSDLTRKLGAARRNLDLLRAQGRSSQEELERSSARVRELEERMRLEKDKLEKEKRFAAQEYLNQYKKNLTRQIHGYLLGDEGIYYHVEAGIREMIGTAEQVLHSKATELYDTAVQKKLEWVDDTIQSKQPEIWDKLQQIGQVQAGLEQLKNDMEGWLG